MQRTSKVSRFRPAHQKRRDRNLTLILVLVLLPKSLRPACSDENETSKQNRKQHDEHQHPPARPQTVGSDKNLLQPERGMGNWLERFSR